MGRGQIKPPPGYVLDEKKITPPPGYVLDSPPAQAASKPGIMSRIGSTLTEERIPLEKLVDATWPNKNYPGMIPVGMGNYVPAEVALGAAKVIGRTVQKMSSPLNLGLGVGAAVLSEAEGTLAIMGLLVKGAFSTSMIKSAYDQFTKEQKPDAPLHERIADKGSGLVDALMAIMPWKSDIKAGIANRNVKVPSLGSEASAVTPPRPVSPVLGAPVRPTDPPTVPELVGPEIARPGPVSEAIVSPRTPNVSPRAPYVPENDPNYVKAMADQANDVTAKATFDRAIADMRTPPTTGLMEDAPVTEKPVGSLGLRERLTEMPEIPDDVRLAGLENDLWRRSRDQFIESMRQDFTQGIGELSGKGKVLNTADMNAQATANLTQKDTGFGKMRLKSSETYGDEIANWAAPPGMIAEAIATKGQARFTSGKNAGKSKGLGKLYQDILAASDRQVRSREDIGTWVREQLEGRSEELRSSRLPKGDAYEESGGDISFDPAKGFDPSTSDVGSKSAPGSRWGGEEGFAAIKDKDLGRKVNPEDFWHGFIGRDGKFYEIRDEHQVAMAKSQGRKSKDYHLVDFITDMAENQIIRAGKTRTRFSTQAFGKMTSEQRQAIASASKDVPPQEFDWQIDRKQAKDPNKWWGSGIGDMLRGMKDEEGFARLRDDKQKGFEFNPVASAPKKADPVTDLFKNTEEQPQPIMDFRNALAKIQEDTRSASEKDLYDRIMKAPDTPSMSKIEQLGLDKKRKIIPSVEPRFLFNK